MSAHPPLPPADNPLVTIAGTRVEDQREAPRAPRYVLIDTQSNSAIAMSSRVALPTVEDERAFTTLAEQWRAETRHMSLAADKAANFHLHQIIGMGDRALPLILEELQSKTTDWFWALRAIARDRAPIIPPEDQGIVRRIADIWIQWGSDNGYLRS